MNVMRMDLPVSEPTTIHWGLLDETVGGVVASAAANVLCISSSFTNSNSTYITAWTINGDSSRVIDAAPLDSPVTAPALDVAGGRIYWASAASGGSLLRADYYGNGEQVVLTQAGANIAALWIDEQQGRVYWTRYGASSGSGEVLVLDLQSQATTVLIGGLEKPYDLAGDPARGRLYWSDWDTDKIQFTTLAPGGSVADLVTTTRPAGLSVHPVTGEVFWASPILGTIFRVRPDGTGIEAVTASWPMLWDVQVVAQTGVPSVGITGSIVCALLMLLLGALQLRRNRHGSVSGEGLRGYRITESARAQRSVRRE